MFFGTIVLDTEFATSNLLICCFSLHNEHIQTEISETVTSG